MRRKPTAADVLRTFHPSTSLKLARGTVETCRVIPMMVTFAIGVGVLIALQAAAGAWGWGGAALSGGVVLLIAGGVAGAIAVVAKWVVVGRIRAVEHPLWSSFVWRNEVSDTFVETVAAPWFAPGRQRHPGDERVAARAGREDRPRRGARPTGCPRPIWSRSSGPAPSTTAACADPPVPRPDHADGHGGAEAGATLGTHCVALPAARLRQGRPSARRRW